MVNATPNIKFKATELYCIHQNSVYIYSWLLVLIKGILVADLEHIFISCELQGLSTDCESHVG